MINVPPVKVSPYLASRMAKTDVSPQKNPFENLNKSETKPVQKTKFQKFIGWLFEPVEVDNPYYQRPIKQSRIKKIGSDILALAVLALCGYFLFKSSKSMRAITEQNTVFNTKSSHIWQNLESKPNLDDLALPDKLKDVAKRLIYKIENTADYMAKGGTKKNSFLLWGPPGTGKTTFAQAIAKKFPNSFFASIDLGEIEGKYVGESQQNLNKAVNNVCEVARNNPARKIFVFFDEIDSIAMQDNGSTNQQYHASILNVLKKAISEKFAALDNIIVIAATNANVDGKEGQKGFVQKLSNTIVDRFDEKIKVDSPTASQFAQAVSKHYQSAQKVEECLKKADSTEIRAISDELSKRKCSFRVLENLYNVVASNQKPIVTFQDVMEAIKNIAAEGAEDIRKIGF